MEPEVSIIIINYNTFKLSCECIQSIFDKTEGISFEIILVDNGSVECSPHLFKEKYPGITLVISEQNVGFAKGNNLGIERSTGEYILLLNSDILLTENSILKCIEIFRKDKNVGIVSPKLIYPNGVAQSVANRFASIKILLYLLTRTFKLLPRSKKEKIFLGEYVSHTKTMEVDWVFGAFLVTKKEIIEKLENGKLNDHFFMYYEDVEWCYDIKELGYKVIYYPFTQAIHYGSASYYKADVSTRKNVVNKTILIAENESIFFKKHKGWLYQKAYSFICMLLYLSVFDFKVAKINFRLIFK